MKEEIVIDEETKTRRLLKRGQRSLLRGIFSRTTVIVLLLILQLYVIASGYVWFQQYQIHIQIAGLLIAVASVLYLINSDMDSTAKLTWMLVVLPMPVLGGLFLLYTKIDWGYNGMKRQLKGNVEKTVPLLRQNDSVLAELKTSHSTAFNLAKYLSFGDNHFPVYKNSQVTYFSSGEEKFAELKKQLRQAKHYIFMEYFIIDEGLMWGEILSILEEKVAEGVEVRVMYDGMIEMTTLSFDYSKRLERLGIQSRAFAPLSPFLSTYYNYRDHRKIVVIDGEVAFTGGVNLADEYINAIERFGHWKDTAIMVRGRAVDTFLILFLQMWKTIKDDGTEVKAYLGQHANKLSTDGFIIPFGDSPMDNEKVGENVYIDILNQARDYVHIMTPYLILDSEMEHALKFAAERGVDVKIIMPGIPDKQVPYYLAKTYYKSLMASGVKIYEYSPGFVHAKVFVADDSRSVVGTINLDYRSLYHHFECAAYLYHSSEIPKIERDFQATLADCRQVTEQGLKELPISVKAIGAVVKAIAPLL